MQESRKIIFQPALPRYRLDFFERVERRFGERFTVYYSQTDMGALTASISDRRWARRLSPMRALLPGLEWQPGVLSTPVRRGDIVVVCGGPRTISSMLMLIWAGLRGAKTVWWGHYWSGTSKTHRFFLRRQLMRLASALLFYTDQEVEEYKVSHGKHDRRIVTALNNGIDVDPIAALRAPYDPAKRDKAVLFIGRLTAKAELPLLLKALADPRLGDVRLEVIGDGEERRLLEALAGTLALGDRIVWHGGTTDEAAIARIANNCRLFVYPGGVGLSLLHAMAYGLPVVVHDDRRAQMPEIAAFYRAGNGLSFRRGDSAALANALVLAFERVTVDRTWSDAAIGVTENDFNTKEMAERFCKLMAHLERGDRDAS